MLQSTGDAIRQWARHAACLTAVMLSLASCGKEQPAYVASLQGDAARGRVLLHQYGCGACHHIPHVLDAIGTVGPPLDGMGERVYIAGLLPNTPDNLARWIR